MLALRSCSCFSFLALRTLVFLPLADGGDAKVACVTFGDGAWGGGGGASVPMVFPAFSLFPWFRRVLGLWMLLPWIDSKDRSRLRVTGAGDPFETEEADDDFSPSEEDPSEV